MCCGPACSATGAPPCRAATKAISSTIAASVASCWSSSPTGPMAARAWRSAPPSRMMEWLRLLDEAAETTEDPEKSWVVQVATRLPVHEFPVVGADGRVFGEPFYAVMGFAATENGFGTVCRVSQKQVVNVAQRGGLAALLEAEAPSELAMPTRSVNRSAAAE